MSPPSTIAHYRITSKLGEGGMGAVYRATDTKLNRDVAIKVLPDSFAADPDRLARFTRESQVLAALNHPNIAAIYGVEDRALVMELVEGQAIQGPLPIETALDYAGQIAEALEYAHEKGIVHRDLKPANVLVTGGGIVKVLDFGLAKALSADPSAADPATSPTLTMRATQLGVILGTAGYMSPEQAKGKPVDRRTDIWAFGVVLWEMLTGRLLFEGETVSDILAQVLTKEPDWNLVPAPVRKLLRSCLSRDPKQRLKSIGDWRLLLEDPTAAPGPPPQRSRPPWAIAAAAVIALAAGWGWQYRAEKAAPALYRVNIVPPEGTTLHLDVQSPPQAISPDGSSLAFLADTEGVTRIWVRALNASTARQFPGTELADGLFWSPDSRRLGFSAGNDLKILDVSTGAVKMLRDAGSTVRGGTWNSAGTIVYGATATGLMSIPADGGKIVAVTAFDLQREGNELWPQFLPDGKHFIYWIRGIRPEDTGVYAGSLDIPPEKQIRRQILATPNAALYADGYLLFTRGKTLFAQPFDTDRLELKGTPAAIAELESPRDFISVSKNGILTTSPLAYLSKTVTIVSRDGKTAQNIGAPDAYASVRVSPDGRTVALARSNTEVGTYDLWLMDLSRGVPVPLTGSTALTLFPVWSPDGREIVYASNREGGYRMFRRAIAGSGSEQKLLATGQIQLPSDWSKDGKTLIFTDVKTDNDGVRESRGQLLTLVPESQPVALSMHSNILFPRLSPAGRWVAVTTRETGTFEVYVQELPGVSKDLAPRVRVSGSGGLNPSWNADGSELYFNTPDNYLMASAVKSAGGRFKAGDPKRLFALGGSSPFTGAIFWEPIDNGRQFIVLRAAPVTERNNRISVLINWQEALKSRP